MLGAHIDYLFIFIADFNSPCVLTSHGRSVDAVAIDLALRFLDLGQIRRSCRHADELDIGLEVDDGAFTELGDSEESLARHFLISYDVTLSNNEFCVLHRLRERRKWLCHSNGTCQRINLYQVTLVSDDIERGFALKLIEYHSTDGVFDKTRPK
jgi:hypothetical protein